MSINGIKSQLTLDGWASFRTPLSKAVQLLLDTPSIETLPDIPIEGFTELLAVNLDVNGIFSYLVSEINNRYRDLNVPELIESLELTERLSKGTGETTLDATNGFFMKVESASGEAPLLVCGVKNREQATVNCKKWNILMN